MDWPHFTWVDEQTALNLDLVTMVRVQDGAVRLWEVGGGEPLCTLKGDDAQRFLTWFNRRAASSRNG